MFTEELLAIAITRVRKAEARVAELEALLVREEKSDKAWKWAREVGDFLLKALRHKPGHSFDLMEGSRLFNAAIALGIIPDYLLEGEPWPNVLEPGRTWEVRPGDGCPCPPEEPYPGDPVTLCPKCGGRILTPKAIFPAGVRGA